jgi:hypothetical protein
MWTLRLSGWMFQGFRVETFHETFHGTLRDSAMNRAFRRRSAQAID